MKNVDHPQQREPQPYLPRNSSENRLGLFRIFKKPVLLLSALLVAESTVGVPGLRVSWRGPAGSYDPGRLHHCQVVNIYGERHFFGHHKYLITLTKPRLGAWGLLKEKAISCLP